MQVLFSPSSGNQQFNVRQCLCVLELLLSYPKLYFTDQEGHPFFLKNILLPKSNTYSGKYKGMKFIKSCYVPKSDAAEVFKIVVEGKCFFANKFGLAATVNAVLYSEMWFYTRNSLTCNFSSWQCSLVDTTIGLYTGRLFFFVDI